MVLRWRASRARAPLLKKQLSEIRELKLVTFITKCEEGAKTYQRLNVRCVSLHWFTITITQELKSKNPGSIAHVRYIKILT